MDIGGKYKLMYTILDNYMYEYHIYIIIQVSSWLVPFSHFPKYLYQSWI